MAVSRTTTAILTVVLVARLLAMAVLVISVVFIFLANNTDSTDYKLESYMYVFGSGVAGLAGSLLQIPAAIYLLCKSCKTPRENNPPIPVVQRHQRRPTPKSIVRNLDISMYADIVMSPVLASGVGAGFDAWRCIRASRCEGSPSQRSDLIDHYNHAAVVLLLVGTLLCICATVVSVRLRASASNN